MRMLLGTVREVPDALRSATPWPRGAYKRPSYLQQPGRFVIMVAGVGFGFGQAAPPERLVLLGRCRIQHRRLAASSVSRPVDQFGSGSVEGFASLIVAIRANQSHFKCSTSRCQLLPAVTRFHHRLPRDVP